MQSNVLVLDNVRSVYNVGTILRTCDALGVTNVVTVGLTPHPAVPNDTRPAHVVARAQSLLAKTALGAEANITIDHFDELASAMSYLWQNGYKIYALEQAESSEDLNAFTPSAPWALVVGHEREGVQELTQMDAIVEIPMQGSKESLNVAVATGLALYQLINNA